MRKNENKDINVQIGINIANLRISKNLTQEDLAGEAELDRSYLSEIENGHKNISVKVLKKIATSLNVKMSDLLGE